MDRESDSFRLFFFILNKTKSRHRLLGDDFLWCPATSYSCRGDPPTTIGGCETRWAADFFVSRSRSVLAYAIRSEPLFLASSNSLPLRLLAHLLRERVPSAFFFHFKQKSRHRLLGDDFLWCPATSYSCRGRPPTTIGAEELNFRVRYGNGCDLFAIITRLLSCSLKTG